MLQLIIVRFQHFIVHYQRFDDFDDFRVFICSSDRLKIKSEMSDTTQSRPLEDKRKIEDPPAWSVHPARVSLKILNVVSV
jgi:hypothetical protein